MAVRAFFLLTMPQVVEIPILFQRRYANELTQFQLPQAVHDSAEPTLRERLQFLLDRQDAGTTLSDPERREAEGLVDVTEFLSLLRLRLEAYTQEMADEDDELLAGVVVDRST